MLMRRAGITLRGLVSRGPPVPDCPGSTVTTGAYTRVYTQVLETYKCLTDGRHFRGFIYDPAFIALLTGGSGPKAV